MFWTFEVLWPAPFASGWIMSTERFDNITDAAEAMADYAVNAACNGSKLGVRLTKVDY